MSTNNFYNQNASKIYAVDIEEDFDYDLLLESLQEQLPIKLNEWEKDGLHSLEGKIVGSIDKLIGNGKWRLVVQAIIRNGYYSGVNLDWSLKIIDQNDQVHYGLMDTTLPKYVTNAAQSLINKMERIFKSMSTPLIKVAQFSNGEAVYKKA